MSPIPNALIVSLDDARVLSLQEMSSVLSRLFGAEALAEGDKPFSTLGGYSVVAVPQDGRPRFQAMGMDHSIALEGSQEAIDLVLAEVRRVLPDDHPRVIGVQSEDDLYVDLPVGVTAEQVATGWKEVDAGLDDFRGEERSMSEFAAGLPRRAGAGPSVLRQALRDLRVSPPEDYLQFMLASDGTEGSVGEGYVQLWSAGELVELNEGYEVKEFAPGLVLFGSDGGDEAYAFDTSTSPATIVSVPFIGMAREEATALGSTFEGFLSTLANDFVA